MRFFHLLPTLKFSALCLAVVSPALSQDSIPTYKIIDFEMSSIQSTLGNYGGTYADNSEMALDSITYGNSLITTVPYHEDPDSSLWVPGHDSASFTAMQLGYQLGTVRLGCGDPCTYAPHIGLAIGFSSSGDPIELSGATHVTFWAKGRDSLTVNVSLGLRDTVTHAADYSQRFVIDTTWKKYSIELKASTAFKLPEWVAAYPFEAARVNSISFSINRDENLGHPDNALFLDDVEIVNWTLSYVSGIFKHGRNAAQPRGLKASFVGNNALVRLPAAFVGKTGVIEALDMKGRKIGQAAFGPQALDVSLNLAGSSAKSAGIYFRAITK